MSRILSFPKGKKAAAATATPVDYKALAATLRAALEALPAQIPFWQIDHPLLKNQILPGRVANGKFIATVTNAVENSQALQTLGKFDLADAEDMLEFLRAFGPIVDVMAVLARDLQVTMDVRQAKVGVQALQVYYLAKGLGRDIGGAEVLSMAELMKRDLGRRGPKPRGKGVPTTTPQSPQTQSEQQTAEEQVSQELPKAA
jgi:hypothetical protein